MEAQQPVKSAHPRIHPIVYGLFGIHSKPTRPSYPGKRELIKGAITSAPATPAAQLVRETVYGQEHDTTPQFQPRRSRCLLWPYESSRADTKRSRHSLREKAAERSGHGVGRWQLGGNSDSEADASAEKHFTRTDEIEAVRKRT